MLLHWIREESGFQNAPYAVKMEDMIFLTSFSLFSGVESMVYVRIQG